VTATAADAALLLACGRHPLAAELARGLREAGVEEGARVLLATSGGADSTALLALAAGLARSARLEPAAAHVDHGLRAEAAAEGDAVAAHCAHLGVPLLRRRLALAPGPGLADRARAARYDALAAMAQEWGTRILVTAHHADDQLETLLLAIARGSGLRGLGGMPARREDERGVALVRPLLQVPRAALREACAALGLAWCEDPTNDDERTARGRLRAQVLPPLESLAPGAGARAARTALLAQAGAALLEERAAQLLGEERAIAREAARGAPLALVATALHLLVGDRLAHAELWRAAELARDAAVHPRRIALAGGGALLIDVRSVRVEAGQGGSAPVPERQRS
jgi:tRNA(Ile)-lysidine synthase